MNTEYTNGYQAAQQSERDRILKALVSKRYLCDGDWLCQARNTNSWCDCEEILFSIKDSDHPVSVDMVSRNSIIGTLRAVLEKRKSVAPVYSHTIAITEAIDLVRSI